MLSRRILIASLFATPAFGNIAEHKPFTREAFMAAQAANKSILVEIYAPWCLVCRAQRFTLKGLATQPEFKKIEAFVIDYDSQKEFMRDLKAPSRSTLIVFKGKTERGRVNGASDNESLQELLKKAL